MPIIRTAPPTLAQPDAVAEDLQAFIREAVWEADAEGLVVNLSGGIDSTVSATLATDALGSDRVLGLILPTEVNRAENIDDARQVAEELVIDHRVIEIQELLDTFTRTVSTVTKDVRSDPLGDSGATMTIPTGHRENYREAVGNTAARIRMLIAYFEANTTDRLVLGTGNRTELLLGYFTKYGDGAADLLPIGDLYKSEVRQLAETLDVREEIITKPPTAGLWRGQEDESELGAPYDTIDTILWNLRDAGATPGDVADALDVDEDLVARFERMIERTAHKRQMPPRPDARLERA